MVHHSLCGLDSYPLIVLAVVLAVAALVGMVIYYVLMVRAILEMLAQQAPLVLQVFSLVALIPAARSVSIPPQSGGSLSCSRVRGSHPKSRLAFVRLISPCSLSPAMKTASNPSCWLARAAR